MLLTFPWRVIDHAWKAGLIRIMHEAEREPAKAIKLDAEKRRQEPLPRRRRQRFALVLLARDGKGSCTPTKTKRVGVCRRFSAFNTAVATHIHE